MEEDLDLSKIGFPVLADPFDEDFPLQLCRCPYCGETYWIIPRSDYYFTCSCGGMAVFDGVAMRFASAAEYRWMREIRRAKPAKTVGLA